MSVWPANPEVVDEKIPADTLVGERRRRAGGRDALVAKGPKSNSAPTFIVNVTNTTKGIRKTRRNVRL